MISWGKEKRLLRLPTTTAIFIFISIYILFSCFIIIVLQINEISIINLLAATSLATVLPSSTSSVFKETVITKKVHFFKCFFK